MLRRWGLAVILFTLAPASAIAQAKRAEPAPVCTAACAETCQKELTEAGCNPAIGLTACRMRQDQCVAACTRKCHKS